MERLTASTAPSGESVDSVGEPSTAITSGRPWPMGAHCDADGVNFAVFSANAQAIDLCVFDPSGTREVARHRLPGHTNDVWHGHLAGAGAGLVYGLRAHGPWRPDKGHRFNPTKLLLDPYAREIVGRHVWADEHFAADRAHPRQMDTRDNAASALKARVVADAYDWGDDRPPATAWADTVLYELHVKGFSKRNPGVPEALRGTYAGLGHPASIAHLRRLGVTAVSLLPVHYRIDEERLVRMGLTNYWGYNTLGFFAPEPRLGHTPDDGGALRDEFRAMVRALHGAGIEVILDVVFNHTAEGDASGPMLSFKGLDNASYYRLPPQARHGYENDTGCGNTVDLRHPRVLQLVMDSLRYWVAEMHVDGYRFDLAPILGRGDEGFSRRAAFFAAVAQDPVLAPVKLIAEPWDLGPGGYQVGEFPNGWAEWNDKFRDDVRSFWLRHPSTRGAFAQRLCASSDLYQARARSPAESVNYVVSHDGFTLRDLVSYRERHNLANGEDNRDGTANNLSFNAGVEGASDDSAVNALRRRLQRTLLATTLLAQGTPMLCAGDELGHSQGGNNNPYCHDSPTTWIDWSTADADLAAYTARVILLRRAAQPFANRWYSGLTDPLGLHDLTWLTGAGQPLRGDAWRDPDERVLGCLIGQPGSAAAPLLMLINASAEDRAFLLPAGVWEVLLDSTHPKGLGSWQGQGEVPLPLPSTSLLILAAAGAGIRL
ncbi:MAG: glycogen debranching protein GlgX [Burkholderiales bacterium]|nr:glycogen debranching protein GlgX [Burkholderiales bacterium]